MVQQKRYNIAGKINDCVPITKYEVTVLLILECHHYNCRSTGRYTVKYT